MSEQTPQAPVVVQPPRPRGDGSIYLRGTIWWIRYWRRGKEHRESSHSADPVRAQKLLDQKIRHVRNEREGIAAFIPRADKVYVDELLDELEKNYKLGGGRAWAQFQSHMKPVRRAFGDMRAVHVTPKTVDDYIDDRLDIDEMAPATVNRETQLLGQAFRLGIERRKILTAPHIRRLSERNVRQGFFERAEFEAILANLPDYLHDFTRFAHLCAWRKGQIAKLEWCDVDRSAGIIIARPENVKNEHPHKMVIEGELTAIIERRWQAREYTTKDGRPAIAQYVFHRNGARIGDFRKAWATACKAAGLVKPELDKNGQPVTRTVTVDGKRQKEIVMVPSRIFHDFRRSGVRNMVRAGVREGVAMAISGHRTRSVFDRYNISSEDDLRQAIKQTSEHLAAQPAQPKVVSIATKKGGAA
jgi:integrase